MGNIDIKNPKFYYFISQNNIYLLNLRRNYRDYLCQLKIMIYFV